jgi:hypothetical protein
MKWVRRQRAARGGPAFRTQRGGLGALGFGGGEAGGIQFGEGLRLRLGQGFGAPPGQFQSPCRTSSRTDGGSWHRALPASWLNGRST